MATQEPLIKIRTLSKSYAAKVLDNVDLDLNAGEVLSLVGENGAGKSTLAKIICGLTPADGGTLYLNGRPHAPRRKKDADLAGIRMVMQELNLIPTLSVAENLFLGNLPRRFGVVDYRRLRQQASKLLEWVGLEDVGLDRPVGELGIGKQQMIEIAANLAEDCRVLILDEPTAMLTDREVELLFRQIRRLRREGVGIVFISHRLEEVRMISDRIAILRDGRIVGAFAGGEINTREIVNLMAGRNVEDPGDSTGRTPGGIALEVRGFRCGDTVKDVGFTLRKGEILGFAGLVGSGRTETLRLVFGADKKDAGTLLLGGNPEPVTISSPGDAVARGIAMITEDRKEQGLLLNKPIGMNMTLAKINGVSRLGFLSGKKERRVTRVFGEKMSLKSDGAHQNVEELSGGNQQKVVIGRWLYPDCGVLLFDEPTRGIDVGAKFDIYRLLRELADAGKAIAMVSSDLRELIMVCDRIAVMSAGRLVAAFDRKEFNQEKILRAAFSGHMTAKSP